MDRLAKQIHVLVVLKLLSFERTENLIILARCERYLVCNICTVVSLSPLYSVEMHECRKLAGWWVFLYEFSSYVFCDHI
jgi:hypothetical protein